MNTVEDIGADHLGSIGDEFYQALMEAHDGLSFAQSSRLNARLVLLLANKVADIDVLQAALATARENVD